MFSNPADVLGHLRSNISFKTYSDSKLASLYLDDPDNFPFHLMVKVFDVILDPRFKLEDITFKSLWDIFDHISTFRRQALTRPRVEIEPIAPPEAHACSVPPPLAVGLVVDRMIEDRLPQSDLAEEDDWKKAYKWSVADYHAMSLVHSTWTPIARRALQRRVVVPYHQIDRFLLSPLCGPWIREMIVYWTIDNGDEGATCDDVDLLRALWKRTPQVRSLAFVSSLIWPTYQWDEHDPPPFRVSNCLELMPDLVPDLESLWLGHFSHEPRTGHILRYHDEFGTDVTEHLCLTTSLELCVETSSLINQVARLRSLKLLSASGWEDIRFADLEQHPTLEIFGTRVMGRQKQIFDFRVSRDESDPIEFSHRSHALEMLERSTCAYLELRLDYAVPPVGTFPPSFTYLRIHGLFFKHTFMDRPLDLQKIQDFCDLIRTLPHLRSLVLSPTCPSPEDSRVQSERVRLFARAERAGSVDGEGRIVPSHPFIELCKERRIRLAVEIGERSIQIC